MELHSKPWGHVTFLAQVSHYFDLNPISYLHGTEQFYVYGSFASWCLLLNAVLYDAVHFHGTGDVNAERLSQDLGVPCQPCDVKRTQRSWYHLATPRLNQDVLAYAATQTHGQATDSTEVAATAGDPPSSGATPDRAVADQTVDASVTEDDVIHAAVEFHDWLGAMLCGIKL